MQATYLEGSYVIREPEVGMTCRLGIVGLRMKLVATSSWRGIAYRTGIIEHHGIEHIGFASSCAPGDYIDYNLWANKGSARGARRTVTVSHDGVKAS